MAIDGILLVDKPKDWTSFDVVAKVRGLVKRATGENKPKVGHTGTLDPLASGLLVLTLGSYCKRAASFSKLDKTYEAEVQLGAFSTTDDSEGTKHHVSTHRPSELEVKAALEQFIGTVQQVPPAFSAIKVGGKRAYKLARAGKPIALETRPVTIHAIEGIGVQYPHVQFTVSASSGTYIRALARDVGKKLGTGAFLSELRRTKVGPYQVADAVRADQLTAETLQGKIIKPA